LIVQTRLLRHAPFRHLSAQPEDHFTIYRKMVHADLGSARAAARIRARPQRNTLLGPAKKFFGGLRPMYVRSDARESNVAAPGRRMSQFAAPGRAIQLAYNTLIIMINLR
jgi:hypothetical protein